MKSRRRIVDPSGHLKERTAYRDPKGMKTDAHAP
jgi:hypothetical protein